MENKTPGNGPPSPKTQEIIKLLMLLNVWIVPIVLTFPLPLQTFLLKLLKSRLKYSLILLTGLITIGKNKKLKNKRILKPF
jgi:hypothetical protein